MRINFHSGPQPAAEPESNCRSSAQTAGRPARNSGTAEDQAQLSAAHVQVQALAAQATQQPEIRAEKVQSLREALAKGEYRVEPEKLAGALISHMLVQRAG
jgi:negative regulator of flagellin synthesis FlgM